MHRDSTHQPDHPRQQHPQLLPDLSQQQQQQQQQQRQQQDHSPHHNQPHRAGEPTWPPPPKHRTRTQPQRRTHPLAWVLAALCTLLWTVIILGGLVILIVYLVFRPHVPHVDIAAATLNAAYLDTGALLNADVTLLANLSNPNRKVDMAFSYVQVDLYFGATMVATGAVAPLALRRGESALRSVHLVASEVPLPRDAADQWRRVAAGAGVVLGVAGRLRARADLGRWLHIRYWLYGSCSIAVGGPPNGVILSKQCRTKVDRLIT